MTGNEPLGIVIQKRDYGIRDEFDTAITVASGQQISIIAGFTSVTRVNARLLALTRAGFLKRVAIGRNEWAYMLPGTSPGNAGTVPAILFTRHQLAVTEVYIAVRYRAIPLPGVRLSRWSRFNEPVSKTIPLKPDAYFELEAQTYIRPFFVEVDLGSEPLPVWRKKTDAYVRQLAASGDFQKIFGQPQFRVLVVANTDRRLAGIRSTVAKSTDKIFWLTSLERIHRDGFWAPIWLRPTGDGRSPLI
jgi:hypothetical protein